MRRLIAINLALIIALPLFGQELTGPEIIRKVNDLFNPQTSYGVSKMTIVTTGGDTRTLVSESWSKGAGEKTLVRYLEPARVKGQAVLMLNNADDIWAYFPRTGRVRKLASHAKKQKMQGSDFSYEDMGGGDAFIDEYLARRLEDEKIDAQNCYTVELTRKPDSDQTYSRLILRVVKENFVPIAIDYYSENDPTLNEKQLVQSDIREIDGLPTAFKIVMYNKLDNTSTMMEMLEVQYNLELDDEMFTERNLKK
ncbi:MAG: outer membrane lipoprotein-sorting protein [Candidatus Neomarinimicrobiota bacterium]